MERRRTPTTHGGRKDKRRQTKKEGESTGTRLSVHIYTTEVVYGKTNETMSNKFHTHKL